VLENMYEEKRNYFVPGLSRTLESRAESSKVTLKGLVRQ